MANIMSNPLQSCAATIKNMQEQRESCTAEIAALEEEKTVIHQAMGVVFDRLVLQNDKLGRLIQERNAFDRAIGEMSQAFEQIVSTSKTLVNVAHREQEGIARQKKQLDLVAQGISIEQQMEMAAAERGEEDEEDYEEDYHGHGAHGVDGRVGAPLQDPRRAPAAAR